MFDLLRRWCERFFRIPPEPGPPPGDEPSTRVFRAAPNFLRYLKIIWAIGTTVSVGVLLLVFIAPLVIMSITGSKEVSSARPFLVAIGLTLLVIVTTVRLLRLVMLQLDFEKRWYVVTDRSLRIREGVVHVREMTITFANIQNIEVLQGPVQRYFQIADLRVDTAGGGNEPHPTVPGASLHTAFFRGIANAAEVKALIQDRLRGLKDSGLGDLDDPRPVTTPWMALDASALAALREVLEEARALRLAAARK